MDLYCTGSPLQSARNLWKVTDDGPAAFLLLCLCRNGWPVKATSLAITEDEVILQHQGETGAKTLIRTGWKMQGRVHVPTERIPAQSHPH